MAKLSPIDPGFKFFPADHQLIAQFLRPRLAGLPVDGRLNFHDVDAYSVSPDDLVRKREHTPGTDRHDGKKGYWYFFTPARRHEARNGGGGRRQRAVGEGYTWHSEGGEKAVLDDEGRRVGYKLKLSYGFKESPAARNLTRLGWCMTEFGLDDAGAGLVLCKVCVSRHKTTTTYASVMKATADSKKRKAVDDPQPDAPRPKTLRRQEMDLQLQEPAAQLQEIEHLLNSDEDFDTIPAGAVRVSSVDPAGFFTDILDVDEFCRTQQSQAEDDGTSECTYQDLFGDDDAEMDLQVACPPRTPAFVSCSSSSSHVMARCWKQDCDICIQQMIEELNSDDLPWLQTSMVV